MGNALKLGCIIMASGNSTRFHCNKLLTSVDGRVMIDIALDTLPAEMFNQIIVVTKYPQIALSAAMKSFTVVENLNRDATIATTISLGVDELKEDIDGCMFMVCDQPFLTSESIRKLARTFVADPHKIYALGHNGKRGNPVFFPKSVINEFYGLGDGMSGNVVIDRHLDLLTIIDIADPRELKDIDSPTDME